MGCIYVKVSLLFYLLCIKEFIFFGNGGYGTWQNIGITWRVLKMPGAHTEIWGLIGLGFGIVLKKNLQVILMQR